jgi:hypothetical protein
VRPKPEIPDGPVGRTKETEQDGPMFAWTGSGAHEPRDVTKPIAFDEKGRPLYAPRGILYPRTRPGAIAARPKYWWISKAT